MRYRNDLIKGKMAQLDISVEQLAEKTELAINTIINVRKGGNVTVETLAVIAESLQLPLDQLFRQEGAAGV
jgi:transcriptional regulator with XRE-family HTH domain